MTKPPRVGWVRIDSIDPPIRVLARLAADRPDVGAGYGGWQEVPRPRRAPLTTWQGAPGLRLTLPILLDRFASGLSIEREIKQIERLGMPTSSDGEPPLLHIVASGSAIPYQGRTWVLDSITYGDALMNWKGNRTRQQMTLALLEHVADVYLTEKSAATRSRRRAAQAKTKRGAAQKRIVASRKAHRPGNTTQVQPAGDNFGQGESLAAIAARELGDHARWPEIARLNGLRDPQAIRPGQVLRLP